MRDKIEIVETDQEAAELGWTCLGRALHEEAWQGTAWVWCKQGKFVLLNGQPNGYCNYLEEVPYEEAMLRLYETRKWEEENRK